MSLDEPEFIYRASIFSDSLQISLLGSLHSWGANEPNARVVSLIEEQVLINELVLSYRCYADG